MKSNGGFVGTSVLVEVMEIGFSFSGHGELVEFLG